MFTQLLSKWMVSRMASFVSTGGRFILNLTAFAGTLECYCKL